jgi:hypothetical protein
VAQLKEGGRVFKKFLSQLGRHNHGFKRMIEYGLFRKENEKFCLKETSLKIYRSS